MQMWMCWRAREDRKNKLHLESGCLGWKQWAVRAGDTAQESELFYKEDSELS